MKKLIVGTLIAIIALGGAFTTAVARDTTEATVEMRVWQAVSDPLRVYLSARPAGGEWGETERLPMDETNRRETFLYTDRIVPVPGAGGTAGVDVRVWQAVSDPLRVYLSARPSGGEWGETERLAMDETNRGKTFLYTDRIVVVPLPEALPDVLITFWGEFSEERQTEIRDETRSVVAYFADSYGVLDHDFELHVGDDDDSLTQARRDVLGVPNPSPLVCGTAVNHRVFISDWCATRTYDNTFPLARGYFQVLQTHLASSGSASASVVVADWLLEGTAHYMGIEYGVAKGYFQRQQVDSDLLGAATSAPFDLRIAEADIWDSGGGGSYVAAYATAHLIRQTSAAQVMDFFGALRRIPGWQEAFSQAFGMSTEAFYADLAGQRTPLSQVLMRVLNPDGSHLDSAFVIARRGGFRQSRVVDRPSQSFHFSLPDGNYHFDVYATNCLAFGPGSAIVQAIARYPSEGRVETHDGLEILVQLPDWPSELNINCSQRDRYAIRGTLVSTGDHDFTTYNLIVRATGLWGEIYLDASGAQYRPDASGAFEILVPDGYEYRIWLQDKCREEVGWYVSGQDVVPWAWEQATGVSVDGTDVTGIRIRLPEVIQAADC